jgi:hypothetical protein
MGRTGIVLGLEASRLARNNADWPAFASRKRAQYPCRATIADAAGCGGGEDLGSRGPGDRDCRLPAPPVAEWINTLSQLVIRASSCRP